MQRGMEESLRAPCTHGSLQQRRALIHNPKTSVGLETTRAKKKTRKMNRPKQRGSNFWGRRTCRAQDNSANCPQTPKQALKTPASEPSPLDSTGWFAVTPPQRGPWLREGRWSHTLLPAALEAGHAARVYRRQLCYRRGAAAPRLPVLRSSCSEPLRPKSSCTAPRGKLVKQCYWDTRALESQGLPFWGKVLGNG